MLQITMYIFIYGVLCRYQSQRERDSNLGPLGAKPYTIHICIYIYIYVCILYILYTVYILYNSLYSLSIYIYICIVFILFKYIYIYTYADMLLYIFVYYRNTMHTIYTIYAVDTI